MPLTPRIGSWSRVVWYDEGTTPGVDPGGAGFSLPLTGPSGLQFSQPLISTPIFKGDMRPMSKVMGMFNAAGKIPLAMEFLTIGRLLKNFFGSSGYVRPGGGTTTLHRFTIPTAGAARGTCQFENVHLQATLMAQRARYCMINNVNFKASTSGFSAYDLDVLGTGDIANTQLNASPTDDGQVPTNYFNGTFKYKGVALAELQDLALGLMGNVSAIPVAFNAGVNGALAPGNIEPKGSAKLMLTTTGSNPGADLNYWNDATASTEVALDCLWADAPIAATPFPAKWLRIVMPTVRFGAQSFVPGGMGGLYVQQSFEAARSVTQSAAASSFAAELFTPTLGPYTLPATPNLGIKIDGAATITVALTAGSQTATQIVTALNASGPFTAVATADVFNGRVRITSKQTAGNYGATSSVQIDGAVATPAHTQIGFDTVARAGISNCELMVELFNSLGSNYA